MAFDNILCEALQHSIEKFTVPPHVPGFNYALPRVIFRMFDFTDVPEDTVLPGWWKRLFVAAFEALHDFFHEYVDLGFT